MIYEASYDSSIALPGYCTTVRSRLPVHSFIHSLCTGYTKFCVPGPLACSSVATRSNTVALALLFHDAMYRARTCCLSALYAHAGRLVQTLLLLLCLLFDFTTLLNFPQEVKDVTNSPHLPVTKLPNTFAHRRSSEVPHQDTH